MNKISWPSVQGTSPFTSHPGYVSLIRRFHGLHLGGRMEERQETVEGGRNAEIYFWLSHESAL